MVKLSPELQIRLLSLTWTIEDVASILYATGCPMCNVKSFRKWVMAGEMPDYWYVVLLRLLPVLEKISKEG